jgi:hypothetical protein
MAKFMAIHPVGKELTLEAATPIAIGVKANVTVNAYWVRSWYAREEGNLYCEWDAKDAESVRKALAKGAPEFPLGGIYELQFMLNAEDFRR